MLCALHSNFSYYIWLITRVEQCKNNTLGTKLTSGYKSGQDVSKPVSKSDCGSTLHLLLQLPIRLGLNLFSKLIYVLLIGFIDWILLASYFLHKDNKYIVKFPSNIQVICQQFYWFLWFISKNQSIYLISLNRTVIGPKTKCF